MNPQPTRRVAGFIRLLRHEGFTAGVAETVDALTTLGHCTPPELVTIRAALRSLLCRDRDEWARFDRLFDRYWLPGRYVVPEDELSAAERIDPRLRRRRQAAAATGMAHGEADAFIGEANGHGAGRQKILARADFRFLTEAHERRQIERLAERLARTLRKRSTRRRRITHRGRRIHVRRTLRQSLASGGLPVHRRYVERRREPPRLVLLQDVSHSMAQYSPLLTRFVRGLLRAFRDAEAFAFHTELHRITALYRETDTIALRRRLERMNHLWLGGTRIAESLACFNRQYAGRLVNARTVVIVLSDGFDTDEPAQLLAELHALRKRARRIIWLNPALGREGVVTDAEFPPELRHELDLMVPAHSLTALAEAVERIARG